MVVNRRRKSSRAHNLHGWGRNKHRNSGMRGGYGNAGSGKKCDSHKTRIWKEPNYMGKHGFVNQQPTKINAINLRDVEDKLPTWLEQKQAQNEKGTIIIDLTELGYNKLLNSGKVTKKLKITVESAAQGADEKIKTAGGELVVKA